MVLPSSRGDSKLKDAVRSYWNRRSCDTENARSQKFSFEYFEEIERWRYAEQPFIHSFAQFTRYHGKKVIEVGFGAGTDFIQWLRAGARASGIDLTQEALDNLTNRIDAYKLPPPETIQMADAENLLFASNELDLGYSFGVLHYSPNALLRGRPRMSFRWALWNHMESIGTKGYSRREIREMLSQLPLKDVHIRTEATAIDLTVQSELFRPLNFLHRLALRLSDRRLGFFHCISATKTA